VKDKEPLFKIDSVHELRALHRMLMRRKFEGPPDEFFRSPFVASITSSISWD